MATPDILFESFEAAGYDNAGWSENVGSGSVVDEDSTAGTPVDGSKTLKIQKVSPNYNAQTQWTAGSSKPISYTQIYFKVTAEGLANGTFVIIARGREATTYNDAWQILFKQRADDGLLYFRYQVWNNGGYTFAESPSAISLNTWYLLEVYYDRTNNLYECRQDGSTIMSGSLSGSLFGNIQYWGLGSVGDSYTLTAYYDKVGISSTGWPTYGAAYIPKVIMVM